MKRSLSILVAIIMLLTTLPFSAMAASDVDSSAHDELISKAYEVFPEVSDKIAKGSLSIDTYQASVNDYSPKIVCSVSRNVSNDEILTYTEYDNGFVTLASAKFNASFTTDNTDVSGSITYITATLKGTVANVGCSNVFIAEDFVFAIYGNGYDRIISLGNYYVTNGGGIESAGIGRQIETSSSPAVAYFRTIICYQGNPYNGLYTFSLRNNTPSVNYQNNT